MTEGTDSSGSPVADEAVKLPQPRGCPICGAELPPGQPACPACDHPAVVIDVRRVATTPLPPREMTLIPQFDRLLVLATLAAFASLNLPWLPGLYGPVPGWKVPYATTDIPLHLIRHLEGVVRPESLFMFYFVGIAALIFCRTSRHAGVRDMVAAVVLVAGGGYLLVYFIQQWGWCLAYHYVGPFTALASLGLFVLAGLLRSKFMPWVSRSKVLMLVASAFLLTALFLPWSLDHNGLALMLVAGDFYWLGVPRAFAYLMPVFLLLGFVSFVMSFRDIPGGASRIWRFWAVCLALAALVYFRAMWATYLVGWPLGSWGVLLGLTILAAAGILDVFPTRPFLARLLVWVFVIVSVIVWYSFLTGGFQAFVREFFSPAPRLF